MNAPNIFVCAPYAAANSPRETAARELPAPHSTSHHRASIELGDASTSERMDRSSEGENVDAVEVEGERTESDADTPSASPVVRECRSEAILDEEKNEEKAFTAFAASPPPPPSSTTTVPLYGLSITDFENLRSSTKHDSVGWIKIGV